MTGVSRFVGKGGKRDNLKEVDIWIETGKNGTCVCCGDKEIILWFEGMWRCPLCIIEDINEIYNVGLYIEGR